MQHYTVFPPQSCSFKVHSYHPLPCNDNRAQPRGFVRDCVASFPPPLERTHTSSSLLGFSLFFSFSPPLTTSSLDFCGFGEHAETSGRTSYSWDRGVDFPTWSVAIKKRQKQVLSKWWPKPKSYCHAPGRRSALLCRCQCLPVAH